MSHRKHCCQVHAWRYICCLDAVDLVNHNILFNRLLEMSLEPHFAGALGYADDVVLLAPSPAALRMMLRCCEEFANKRSLQFNPTKT